MKPIHFLPPVIALAIAGGMLGAQRQKIAQLENEGVVLKKRIDAEKNRSDFPVAAPDPMRPTNPEASGDEIDWMEIAEYISGIKNDRGMGDMRKMMSFQRKLQKMDKEQLVAALDKIQTLNLDDEQRMTLENMIIGPLIQKDPELVLNRFSDRISDQQSGMGWQLANALGEWAEKDHSAATAWLDKKIEDGTFASKSLDGKNSVRLNFETNLVAKLLALDPAAAEARIAALPADQRKDALGGYGFQQLKDEEQVAYASLVRSLLSEKEREDVFGQQASMIAMSGSLEKVDSYLNRIGAAGGERIKAAEKAAKSSITGKAHQSKVTEEKIDRMRDWLGTQAPGSVGKVTGETLGQLARNDDSKNFPEVSGMLLKYHDKNGGDDLLVGFLKNTYNPQEKEGLRKIAGMIEDKKAREDALRNLE